MPARPPPRGKAAPFPPGATRGPPFPILELKFEVEFGTGIFRLAGATGGGEGRGGGILSQIYFSWSGVIFSPLLSFLFLLLLFLSLFS